MLEFDVVYKYTKYFSSLTVLSAAMEGFFCIHFIRMPQFFPLSAVSKNIFYSSVAQQKYQEKK